MEKRTFTKEEKLHLTEDELDKLFKLDLTNNKKLERIRDVFLVGAWTGLRYSDLTRLKHDDLDGDYIEIDQFKTGFDLVLPKLPVVVQILEKYNYQLPLPISNQKFNDYIKESCKLAEINDRVALNITKGGIKRSITKEKWKCVSSHTARRSFATNFYNSGLDTLAIMALTGHKTEKEFLKYIKVTPKEYADKLLKHWHENVNLRIAN